jgi:radical SAM superfamily enzyme YgiQ (UPF0313 family)
MKILLIEPTKPLTAIGGEDVFIYEPLALEYVAAGVLDEHEVKILDLRLDKELKTTLTDFRPDIVGITAYTIHVNGVKNLFEQIKAWDANILTVVGGHHATVAPEDFISPFIDLIVIGEGVFAFKEIVARVQNGEAFDDIPGVAFPTGNSITQRNGQSITDLDALPFPARTLTKKYRQHYYSEWMKPLASIRTSKGCPYRCKFCAMWKVAEGHYFKRNPEKIVEELAGIEEECVFFSDDESLFDASRMSRLARLIKEAGIKKRYFLYARSDTITKYPDLLREWRDIGLERIFVGIEFLRDEDLTYIRKKSTSRDNEQAVRILHDLGIDIYASFILRPEFTHTDFTTLREYCRHLELSYASYAVLTPLPGTDLYQEVSEQLIIHNYDYFDFIHTILPTSLPLKEFYAEYHDLFLKGITLNKQYALLQKYPLKELPHLLVKVGRFYKRLKTAYKDYEN